ncbi:hypothetical protein QR680_010337 [Steinernema hermaphroditum]|uniref:Peptidase M13 C-terminal domain-containing protein n=1 Tax=Steinernema hermaphroditum TaxID=289476 RepID=A0AA39IPU8_9BILA|nr:hypothetical protein QR680_010337 [Steinernema hermaphroditum]
MERKTLSLLFLLGLLAQSGHAAKPNLELVLNEKSPPCRDLFDHVCVDKTGINKFKSRKDQGLMEDFIKVLGKHNVEDRIYPAVWKAMVKEWHLSEKENIKCRFKNIDIDEKDFSDGNDYKIGKAFGKMTAYGRFGEAGISVGFADGVYYVRDSGMNEIIADNRTIGEIDNDFVRGILTGFFGEFPNEMKDLPPAQGVHYSNLRAPEFENIILRRSVWEMWMMHLNATKKGSDSMSEIERYQAIFMSYAFSGYGNVLLAHTLYTYKDELNPAVADELTELAKRLLKEIASNVEKSTWISPADREGITAYLKENKIIIGITKKYRDLDLLKRMMGVYHAEFEKVKPEDECQMEMLSRAHGIARHKLIYSGVGSIASIPMLGHNDFSLFTPNAFHAVDTIRVFPAFIHILNDYDLSTGFKYGHTVFFIAHEIFHGLGITERRSLKHLQGVMETRTFKQGKQCLLDFYREEQFCMGHMCPRVSNKIDEGFPDIEGARLVYSLLQEALRQSVYGNRKRWVTSESGKLPLFNWRPPGATKQQVLMSDTMSLSQEQEFFIGVQAAFCHSKYPDDFYLMDMHPRPQIRANAIAQQMAQFTRAFGCKKGDRNYMADKQCGLYSPIDGRLPERVPEAEVNHESECISKELLSSVASDGAAFRAVSTASVLLCALMCLL